MTRAADPAGRRALFSATAVEGAATPGERTAAPGPAGTVAGEGRRALFSTRPTRPGDVVVACSECRSRTPVAPLDLPGHLLPSLWVPWRRPHDRWMRCPACRRRTWCHVDLRPLATS